MRNKFLLLMIALVAIIPGSSLGAQQATTDTNRVVADTNRIKFGKRLQIFLKDRPNEPAVDAQLVDVATGSYLTSMVLEGVAVTSLEFTARPGPIKFMVRKVGYQPIIFEYANTETKADSLVTKELERAPTELPKVVTTAPVSWRQQNFEDHRKAGNGKFFGPDEIRLAESQNILTVIDLLQKRTNTGTRGSKTCLTVFGYNGAGISRIPGVELSLYDAIEVYKGAQIPSSMNITAPPGKEICTAVVVWDRERW